MAEKFHFECVNCKAEYSGDRKIYLCPSCSLTNVTDQPPKGVLKTVYQYERLKSSSSATSLFNHLESERFLPLLPLSDLKNWPELRIGNTPLYRFDWRTGGLADYTGSGGAGCG